MLNIPYYYL